MAEVSQFIDQLGEQLQAGWTDLRERGLDVVMEAEISFSAEVVFDGDPLSLTTTSEESGTTSQSTVEPSKTDTTTVGSGSQVTVRDPVTDTTTATSATQTSTESAYEETTTESSVTDTENTHRTSANTSTESGGDSRLQNNAWNFHE